jgi:hypothetical protein
VAFTRFQIPRALIPLLKSLPIEAIIESIPIGIKLPAIESSPIAEVMIVNTVTTITLLNSKQIFVDIRQSQDEEKRPSIAALIESIPIVIESMPIQR